MATLADVNLELQARLRRVLARTVGAAWASLPAYNRADVDQFLATVLPVVEAAQRRSVTLTDAYIARALERPVLGIEAAELIGAAVRAGTSPETVYTRPFIQTWTALSDGVPYNEAIAGGRHRAESAARMDVQLSHFAAYGAIQAADPAIRGYQRVADASACSFCRIVNGAYVKNASASPLHNGCGCGLKPLLKDITPTSLPDGVAVHEHGELGPLLAAPGQHFTAQSDF